jgi:hypothetical protein
LVAGSHCEKKFGPRKVTNGPVGLMAMKCAWLRGARHVIGIKEFIDPACLANAVLGVVSARMAPAQAEKVKHILPHDISDLCA